MIEAAETLTVTQAAARLQVSRRTIQTYLYDGKLRGVKLPGGTLWRIPVSEIERVLGRNGRSDGSG